jgi:C7-cyclitol 7-kinase
VASASRAPYVVVEVGGTTLRAALFDPSSRQLGTAKHAPAPSYLNHPRHAVQGLLLTAMRNLADDVLEGRQPQLVSVAYPGPVSADGTVLAAPTLLGTSAGIFPLRRACQTLWPDARVTVMNDVTAAGYRYVDEGLRDFCILTVGSGIGHKVFLDGHPVTGPAGRGGEIGHLQVDFSSQAWRCDCGGRGHLGGIASGRGALAEAQREARRQPDLFRQSVLSDTVASPAELDNGALVEAFLSGDLFARRVVATAAGYLGRVLASVHLLVGVEEFVLVGGFALALGEEYRQMVAGAAEGSCWDLGESWDKMVLLGHSDGASGLIGAGLAALSAL